MEGRMARTARSLLQILMMPLGAAAILIGGAILLAGPTWTAGVTESLYNLVAGGRDLTRPFTPTSDSELRFYAPFWITYGGLVIWTALDLRRRRGWVPPLALLFMAGGAGRLISYVVAGPPHGAFVLLMAIELVLPVLMLGLWLAARRRT